MPAVAKAAARLSLVAVVAMGMVACGGSSAPEREVEDVDASTPAAEETVFDDLIQTQDKARAVEGVTLEHKDQLDQALERAEGDDAATAE
jgi:hypothetical protein